MTNYRVQDIHFCGNCKHSLRCANSSGKIILACNIQRTGKPTVEIAETYPVDRFGVCDSWADEVIRRLPT